MESQQSEFGLLTSHEVNYIYENGGSRVNNGIVHTYPTNKDYSGKVIFRRSGISENSYLVPPTDETDWQHKWCY